MHISLFFLITMFMSTKSQQYSVQLIFENQNYSIHKEPYLNINGFNRFVCRKNKTCRNIATFTYYLSRIYIIFIILRGLMILCILILCLLFD